MKTTKRYIVLALTAALVSPVSAQVFPPFEVGDGVTFHPDVQRDDLALQAYYLLPRAPALMQSTQQAARAGLVSARARGMDLRDTLGAGASGTEGGVWLRLNGEFGDRELRFNDLDFNLGAYPDDFNFGLLETRRDAIIENWAESLDYDEGLSAPERQALVDANIAAVQNGLLELSHDHRLYGFNAGFDLIRGNIDNRAWLAGLAIGYLRSTVDFEDLKSVGMASRFDGDTVSIGTYGGFVAGSFYIDAALSYAWHKLDLDLPLMRLRPDGAVLSTDARTLSGQLDAGWRIPVTDIGLYLEPIAGLIWVRADIDDTNVQPRDALSHHRTGNILVYGRQESLRGSVGARFGGQWDWGSRVVTGDVGVRNWREFERGTEVSLGLRGDYGDDVPVVLRSPPVEDDFASSFTEVTLSGGIRTADHSRALGLNLGWLSGGDYESWGINASFRYQW